MNRKMIAIFMMGFLVGFSVETSLGQFSVFKRITPETEEKHGVNVQILPAAGRRDCYRVIVSGAEPRKRTFLIVCDKPLPPEQQDFRAYVWAQRPLREEIVTIAPLLTRDSGVRGRSECAEIVLATPVFDRSYIYIDYPHLVFDGGFYYCIDLSSYPLPEERTLTVTYSPAQGLGPEAGVMRRDPSDIVKAGGLCYVWYTMSHVSHGYDATVWYATSADGHAWAERGEALPRGPAGSWDEQSVFTPNILTVEDRYYLFYTGVPKPFNNQGNQVTKSAIGIAVAESPDGPWRKLQDNPVLRCSDNPWDFDSMRVDDACLVVRGGKYWLYYKGRQWNDTPAHTKMGLAIAPTPEGPYSRFQRASIVKGGHEVLVWPLGVGVAAMLNIGPPGIRRTIQYAPDGLTFSKMMDVDEVPRAPGAHRPEAFTDSGRGRMIEWGLHIGHRDGFLPFLERFDCAWERSSASGRP